MRALIASLLLIATLSSAVGAGAPPDRPPGVAAGDWIPLSSALGVVLAHARGPMVSNTQNNLALIVAPPAHGYFMVKRGAYWQRLVIVEPPGTAGAG